MKAEVKIIVDFEPVWDEEKEIPEEIIKDMLYEYVEIESSIQTKQISDDVEVQLHIDSCEYDVKIIK